MRTPNTYTMYSIVLYSEIHIHSHRIQNIEDIDSIFYTRSAFNMNNSSNHSLNMVKLMKNQNERHPKNKKIKNNLKTKPKTKKKTKNGCRQQPTFSSDIDIAADRRNVEQNLKRKKNL